MGVVLLELESGFDPDKRSAQAVCRSLSACHGRAHSWPFSLRKSSVTRRLWDMEASGKSRLRLQCPLVKFTPCERSLLKRAAVVRAYFVFQAGPKPIKLHPLWHSVEPTEKRLCLVPGRVSLFATRREVSFQPKVSVPRTALRRSLGLCLGGIRNDNKAALQAVPDFLAEDSAAAWHLVEAKGLSGGFNSAQAGHALSQTEAISAINGKAPVTVGKRKLREQGAPSRCGS